jgi:hypothetical protein
MRIKRKLQDWKQKHKLKQAVVVNLVAVVNQDVVHQAAQREQVTGKQPPVPLKGRLGWSFPFLFFSSLKFEMKIVIPASVLLSSFVASHSSTFCSFTEQ